MKEASKRILDVLLSFLGLAVASPVIVPILICVWLQDFHSPFYVSYRVGRGGRPFKIVKIRSMVADAEKAGIDSTAVDDKRITLVGRFIRHFKLDEMTQLWNVLKGDMSLVGPRPNVARGVALFTDAEKSLLDVRPGVTDFASIVFADEGEILKGHPDPDDGYDKLIRPWKSRLGLLYIKRQSAFLDLRLILLTVLSIFSRRRALQGVQKILKGLGAEDQVVRTAARTAPLKPIPPPGAVNRACPSAT